MLIFQIPLLHLMTRYIRAVKPGEYGVKRPHLFFLYKDYWKGLFINN